MIILRSVNRALSIKNKFINLDNNQLQQLEKILFRLFGLGHPNFGDLDYKIKMRVTPANGMQTLIDNVESIADQYKRIRRK